MKMLKQNHCGLLVIAAIALLTISSLGSARADDWGPHHRYYDRDGYWDGAHHYHGYGYYHHHRGYWDERGGTRIWINL